MPVLLFVHGTGVRGESWFRTFDLISRKAKLFLPGVEVAGCQWGDPFGARLNRNGATIPGYRKTGSPDDTLDAASRARWFLLADDPLLEIRILPTEETIGSAPGVEIFENVAALVNQASVLELLKGWSIADLWQPYIAFISSDPEWKATVESITQTAATVSEKMARSVTAGFQQRLRSSGSPNLAGSQRDQLKDALIEPLGGPPLGIEDWLLERVTHFGANRRGSITDGTTPAVGDIIRYQSRGAEIRKFIAERVGETQASYVLAHSLGGIAVVDWLASPEYAAGDRPIQKLITAGSQAPYFYEMDALVSRPFGAGLPETFPKKWLNLYDRSDFLSYLAEPAFPGRATDHEVDNKQPFPDSHSAYWHNDDEVWKTIAGFLA